MQNKKVMRKESVKKIAKERIVELFKQASLMFDRDKKLADRYVELARKIAMKAQYRIPSCLQRRFCKHCFSYLMPGKNLRVRTHEGKVVYYCMECKRFMRFPYIREKKKSSGRVRK